MTHIFKQNATEAADMGKRSKRIWTWRRRGAVLLLAGAILALGPTAEGEGTAFAGTVLEEENTPSGDGSVGEQAEKSAKEPSLLAQSAVLIDGETGRVLVGKNAGEVRPMASTTKIMTCILALENASPDETVEVSDYAASMPDVQLNIRKGETYRLKDLLFSMMLESHNDSAVAIAEHVGGSREGFADMMNKKARDIGCHDTHFITPNGLDAAVEETGEIHSTTAKDLAGILRYCVMLSPKKEEFLEITRAPSHSFSDIGRTRSFSCVNHNALLTSMEGALSGKTGFTGGAGYCYVGAVKKEEKTFIAALLGCGWPPHKTYKWQDIRKLIAYGEENYEYRDILRRDVKLEAVPVKNGIEEQTELEVAYPQEKELKLLMRSDEPVRLVKKVRREFTAPVEAGQEAGQLDYYIGDDLVASYPIRTVGKVGERNLEFCIKTLLKRFAI